MWTFHILLKQQLLVGQGYLCQAGGICITEGQHQVAIHPQLREEPRIKTPLKFWHGGAGGWGSPGERWRGYGEGAKINAL
jgi:hypothetical protein